MKGVVFTNFITMVEDSHGLDVVDRIIEKSNLPSGGAYTAVGTYDHVEMVELVVNLSEELDVPVPALLQQFGSYLFHQLAAAYPQFIEKADDALSFLEHVEGFIHVEVRKLYPDAELPRFECHREGPDSLAMIYESARHFEDLCEGLIRGCLEHYGSEADISRKPLDDGREQFVISMRETNT